MAGNYAEMNASNRGNNPGSRVNNVMTEGHATPGALPKFDMNSLLGLPPNERKEIMIAIAHSFEVNQHGVDPHHSSQPPFIIPQTFIPPNTHQMTVTPAQTLTYLNPTFKASANQQYDGIGPQGQQNGAHSMNMPSEFVPYNQGLWNGQTGAGNGYRPSTEMWNGERMALLSVTNRGYGGNLTNSGVNSNGGYPSQMNSRMSIQGWNRSHLGNANMPNTYNGTVNCQVPINASATLIPPTTTQQGIHPRHVHSYFPRVVNPASLPSQSRGGSFPQKFAKSSSPSERKKSLERYGEIHRKEKGKEAVLPKTAKSRYNTFKREIFKTSKYSPKDPIRWENLLSQEGEEMPKSSSVSSDEKEISHLSPMKDTSEVHKAETYKANEQKGNDSERVYNEFLVPLGTIFEELRKLGAIRPLEWRPKSDPVPANWDDKKYCVYHQLTGHTTNHCYALKDAVQDLIDNQAVEISFLSELQKATSHRYQPKPQVASRKGIMEQRERIFDDLPISQASTFESLVEMGLLKPLEGWKPRIDPLPNNWEHSKYCSYHQFSGHTTEGCHWLKIKIQDLIDNGVLAKPVKREVEGDPFRRNEAMPDNTQEASQEEVVYQGMLNRPRN